MSGSGTRTETGDARSAERSASLGHLLAVWVLIGASLTRLGMALYRVSPTSAPVTAVNAGLLFGTVVVGALWIAGVRPSLRTSALYFVTELVVYLLLSLAFLGSEPGVWRDVAVRALAIAGAAAVTFTDAGRRSRRWLRERGRRFVRSVTGG